jgi:hypothetical protein
MRVPIALVAFAALGATACGGPPPSRFPTAADALTRMRDTYACSRGVGGEAKIDYFDDRGRVRGELLYVAVLPEQLRFDVVSPFGLTVLSLSSDGRDFALYDLQNKQFFRGPANGCNVARFTRVPVPPFALAQMLRGEAPVLIHEPSRATIDWSGGAYELTIPGQHQAVERIRLLPVPPDFQKPWTQQRVRVLEVRLEQRGHEVYRAVFEDHQPTQTAAPKADDDGLDEPIPPSGPACSAEVPRAVRFEVPWSGQDLILKAKEIAHNPPLHADVFVQETPSGVSTRAALCSD